MPKGKILKLTGEYEIREDVNLTALAAAVEEAKKALGKGRDRRREDQADGRAVQRVSPITEWRWANERGANGMPYPEELEWLGYVKVAQHPNYPSSWLMRRDG